MDINTKDKFVIDASFVLAYILNENVLFVDSLIFDILSKNCQLLAPDIINYEVANILAQKTQQNKIKPVDAIELWDNFMSLSIKTLSVDWNNVLPISIKFNLTSYDASYLYLVKSEKSKFLTLDNKLKNAYDTFHDKIKLI